MYLFLVAFGSKRPPKGHQMHPKRLRRAPKIDQDVSRGVPRPPKGPYKSTPCLQDVSRGVPRPSRCSYGPRRCGKMAMEYGAEPSYGLWGPWPSTFDWFHRALGLQNRIPLPIPHIFADFGLYTTLPVNVTTDLQN